MAPPAGNATPTWECRFCCGKDGNRFRNNGSRKVCYGGCKCAKGACFHDNVKPATPSRRTGGQSAKPNDEAKRVRELEAALKKQTAELEKLKNAGASDNGSVDGGAEDQHIIWDKRIKHLRERIALAKVTPSEDAIPGELAAAEAKLVELLRAKEESRPPNARLSSAKSKLAQKEKALDKANAAKSAAEKILAESQQELDKATEAQVEAVEALAAAKADLAAANELVTGKAAAPPAATGEVVSVDLLQAMSVVQLGQLLAQIQTYTETKTRDEKQAAGAEGNPQLLQATDQQGQQQQQQPPPAQQGQQQQQQPPPALDSIAEGNAAGGNQLADPNVDSSMEAAEKDFEEASAAVLESDGEEEDADGAKKKARKQKLREATANLKKAVASKSNPGVRATSGLKPKA